MRNSFVVTLIIYLLISCGFSEGRIHKNNIIEDKNINSFPNSTFTDNIKHESNSILVEHDFYLPIDTASLSVFWETFQKNLKEEKKEKVINVINYPIHAIYFVYFRYSYDCDTVNYIKNEKKYYDIDISKDEALKYYNFMFSDVLKEIIFQTSSIDILNKGIRGKEKPGIVYSFFPKNYRVKINCPNDHNLKFYISYEKGFWSISITGI